MMDNAKSYNTLTPASVSAPTNPPPDYPQIHARERRLPDGLRRINPTEVSQYVRLNQCDRYIWMRLSDRTGQRLYRELGVIPQMIPPILTLSGGEFEQSVETAVRAYNRVIHCSEDICTGDGAVAPEHRIDNGRLLNAARALGDGETLIFLQPHLEATLGGWQVAGDADLLRLERDMSGRLHVIIVDIKSAVKAKIEHGIQLACYHAIVERLLDTASVPYAALDVAVLYRPATDGNLGQDGLSPTAVMQQREAAFRLVGADVGLLEVVAELDAYRQVVETLVTGPNSVAHRITEQTFEEVAYHLEQKCGSCLYNQVCLRDSHDRNDLSLIPRLSARDKRLLREAGIVTVRQLARLKQFDAPKVSGKRQFWKTLVPTSGQEETVQRLATTNVGPHLDELVQRARRVCKDRARQELSAKKRREAMDGDSQQPNRQANRGGDR